MEAENLTNTSGSLDVEHIEQCQEIVYPWQVNLQQLTPGLFTSHMEFLSLSGIMLYREFWSQGVHAMGLSPSGFQMFGTSLKKPTTWCGREINMNSYAHGHTNVEMNFTTSVDSHHLVLLIPDELFDSTFSDDEYQKHVMDKQHHFHFKGQSMDSPVIRWDSMISKYLAKPEQIKSLNTHGALVAELLDDVADLLSQDEQQTRCESPTKCHIITNKLLEMIQAHNDVIPVPKMAKQLGVSQRVLEMALKKTLGVTPSRIMRWQRLQFAQRDLAQASLDSITVSQVALAWGFSELGRFAMEYRQVFGELPSQTLKRTYAKNLPRYIDLLRKK